MYSFFNDYSEGAHPRILAALSQTNEQQEPGYGLDSFSQKAIRLIQEHLHQPEAAVHFVATGTQANLVGLASLMKPYESVIAAEHGHICTHETGAIEAVGHKVHALSSIAGKLAPAAIEDLIISHNDEHSVVPRVVYLSQSTELGTIYSKRELEQLREVCLKHQLYLYIDGARLGAALMAKNVDVTLRDLASLCDMFYIGGAKNGALLGEAMVIVNPTLQKNFRYHLKQRGALLAKARAVSVQFVELFKDGLYFENAAWANAMGEKMAEGIKRCGYSFAYEPQTNQLFPILPTKVIDALKTKYGFYIWEKFSLPEHAIARLVTSWATPEAAVDAFLADLKKEKN